MWFKLIEKHRFVVLDKYYLFSRRHAEQGTFIKKDKSLREKIFFYKKIILKLSNLDLVVKNQKNIKRIFSSFILRGNVNLGFFFLKIFTRNTSKGFKNKTYILFILNIPYFFYLYSFYLIKNITNKVINKIIF